MKIQFIKNALKIFSRWEEGRICFSIYFFLSRMHEKFINKTCVSHYKLLKTSFVLYCNVSAFHIIKYLAYSWEIKVRLTCIVVFFFEWLHNSLLPSTIKSLFSKKKKVFRFITCRKNCPGQRKIE